MTACLEPSDSEPGGQCPTTPSAISSASPPGAKATGRPSAASSTAARRASRSREAEIQHWMDKRQPGPVALHHPAARARTGAHPLRRLRGRGERRAPHHRHADLAPHREHRRALEGLCRDQGQLPARPRRLHLRGQIRHPRLARQRPRLGARDRHARRRRRHRPQGRAGHDRARRAGADGRRTPSTARSWDWEEVDRNPFFCPDPEMATFWADYLDDIRKRGSSIGAVIEVVAHGLPAGLGAPIYGKLDQDIASALMSINAVKGVEIGAGFVAAQLHRRGERRRDAHGQRRPPGVPLQQCRRHPRRHLDRPADRRPLRGQADLVDPDRPPHRSTAPARRSRSRPRAATTLASASAPCRSARRCSPSCSPITISGTAARSASGERPSKRHPRNGRSHDHGHAAGG